MLGNIIGIDLGGTWIKAVLMNGSGDVIHQDYHPTQDDHGDHNWKRAIQETVKEMTDRSPSAVVGVGLSAPGLPNDANTCIAYMPGRLAGLEFFDWSKFLGQKVMVLNDAHAATMAEVKFGAARGHRNALMLTLGTGVGGGVVINGQLYQGNFQKAGHLGHITVDANGESDIVGTPGSLEDAIGNATIQKRSLGRYQSTYELLEAHKHHDPFASWLWLDSIRKLSVGLTSLINVFSPDVIVLGGGITQAEDELFKPLESFMSLYEWRAGGNHTPIVQAYFGDMAGAIGAASFALSKLDKQE
jgi:glucokinase